MRASLATEPGRTDGRNEDWGGCTPRVAVVLDGLSEGPETGCVHGTPWYVNQLGVRLLALADDGERSLTASLAAAITEVADLHSETCDLRHPGSPCSTVAMIRDRGSIVDYLVLADSVVVLDVGNKPVVVQDKTVDTVAQDRVPAAMAAGPGGEGWVDLIETQQALRNQPGGYWVAQVDPAAADHALTGTMEGVRGAALLSDGGALLVTHFRVLDWLGLLRLGVERDAGEVISRTRALEDGDPDRIRWPRYKHRDDATAVFIRF